ncbi:MAG TPA: signal peptidase I, partial [Pseudolysinimonas sp.]|nr:signal peptidase I [Pseudolysinimonas sp.]
MTSTERPSTPVGVLGDVLLWIASIAGAVCILSVIAAVGFHVTLIMFKTGSMAPTIPTGSLAVVHEIPASEIRIGDIVTVDRAGDLPVTHRVTSVTGDGSSRTITLRGDANPTDDVAPYVVDHVRVVWTWIAGWAGVVVWFSNPLVLGGLTVGATALVTWAFWPRDEGSARRGRRRAGGRASKILTTSLSVLVVAGVLVAGTAPGAAQAVETEEVVTGTFLTLTSVRDLALMSSMTAGVPVTWQVGVDATAPDPGTVHLGVAAVGQIPAAGSYSLQVDDCAVRWVAGACSTGSGSWLPATDLTAAIAPTTAFGAHEVGSMDAAGVRWLLLTVTLSPAATSPTAALQLWAWGVGVPLSVGGGPLAATGPAG